jgi:excisionase family DNA binding protein
MIDRLISIDVAAALLGVSLRTMYNMEDRGEIERVAITGRRFGYRLSDIQDIIAGRGNAIDFGNQPAKQQLPSKNHGNDRKIADSESIEVSTPRNWCLNGCDE